MREEIRHLRLCVDLSHNVTIDRTIQNVLRQAELDPDGVLATKFQWCLRFREPD